MQRCAFCGSEFPDHARFCGRCGRAPVATLDAPTTLSSGQVRPVPKQEAEEEEERQRRAFLLDLSFSQGGGGQPGAGHVVIAAGGITLALIHKGGGGTPPRPGTITTFSVPTAGSTLITITVGPDGNLWFTEYHGNQIGRITTGGATTGFSAPTDPASNA